ncbi:MAG: hypothetical protein IJS92_01420 [Paludibacteraceae bacterium]|nr:hypothetical protein [Paludibacteraceae bacterium]
MKKILKLALCAACVVGMVACKGEKKTDVQSDKEAALQRAMKPYVENTVIATYSKMADEGLNLLKHCSDILISVEGGHDYAQAMQDAGASWRAMRKYWEQSEAFLYGPAAAHNIDPHIDSWPLDFNAMNSLLNDASKMAELEEEGGAYVGDKLGYALKGFHAAEYLLFESVEQEGRAIGTGKPHATNLTHAEAVYLLGIVEDLAQQAILLEDCWSGGKINEWKEGVITDGEGESMSYGENYGDYMVNAGQPGSLYKTYQEAAEEIIAGCVDIAGEVAELKMGNPYLSNTPNQRDYIESPYSCTSTTDFADNIRSIKNAYEGAQAGDYSISNYVYSQNSELDGKVRKAIEESIAAIEAVQDFENKAKGDTQVKAAMDKVQELEELLDDEVMALLAK